MKENRVEEVDEWVGKGELEVRKEKKVGRKC